MSSNNKKSSAKKSKSKPKTTKSTATPPKKAEDIQMSKLVSEVLNSEIFKDDISVDSLEEIRNHLTKSLSQEDVTNFKKLYNELYEKYSKKNEELPLEVKLLYIIISNADLEQHRTKVNVDAKANTNANVNVGVTSAPKDTSKSTTDSKVDQID